MKGLLTYSFVLVLLVSAGRVGQCAEPSSSLFLPPDFSSAALALNRLAQPTDGNTFAIHRGAASLPTMTNIVYTTIPNAPASGFPLLSMKLQVLDLPLMSGSSVPQYQWSMFYAYLNGAWAQNILAANDGTPLGTGPQLEVVISGDVAKPIKGACEQNPSWSSQPVLWCFTSYPWTVGHVFHFFTALVQSSSKTERWLAYMVDETNKTTQDIAEWELPVSYGLLNAYPNGVVDYYGAMSKCDDEPYAKSQLNAIYGFDQGIDYDGAITSSSQNECKHDNKIRFSPNTAIIWSGLSKQ